MKKVLFFLSVLFWAGAISAQSNFSDYVCRYGFTFEISLQENWGYGNPVVLSVEPNTSANAGGLQTGDIIESINDQPTQGLTSDEIFLSLQNAASEQIELVVTNLKESRRKLILNRYCKPINAITEKDLAEIYSFYSLESVQSRQFSCPFKTQSNPDIKLLDYKTFAFPNIDPGNEELEQLINTAIKKELEEKGLTESIAQPDLIVHTYYSFNKNPNYQPSANADKLPTESRYNTSTKTWESLPIFFNPLIHSKQAQFLLKFGVRLIDPKKSSGGNLFVVWESEANELIQSAYSLSKYAQFHIPLMLMNYPYCKTGENPKFYYSKIEYNYTGINYNMDDMKEITEVDYSAPAATAGIQPGDVIDKINNIKFNSNTKSADAKYKQFILRTSHLRNPKTQFTNAEGFTRCMYWDAMKYVQISEEFQKPDFSTVFSYLFFFEPYINLSGTNIINIDIKRGKENHTIRVKPVIVKDEIFETR